MSRRKLSTTVYVEPEQIDRLHDLSWAMKVPVAELIRQGIDLALAAVNGPPVVRVAIAVPEGAGL